MSAMGILTGKRARRGWLLPLAALLVLGLAGCLAEDDRGNAPPATGSAACTTSTRTQNANWDYIQANIFASSCALSGCHTGASPAAGLSLDADQYSNVVANYVVPGDPDNSTLYQKVKSGGSMNQNIGSSADLTLIETWIRECAAQSSSVPGITVSPTSGLLTTEKGGSDTFTVVLDIAPSADVTITVSTSDTSEGQVSISPATPADSLTLTFTSSDWSTAQTVTVTGVDDAELDGNIPYTIVLAAAVSDDSGYNGIDPTDVSVTNNDDDTVTLYYYDTDIQPLFTTNCDVCHGTTPWGNAVSLTAYTNIVDVPSTQNPTYKLVDTTLGSVDSYIYMKLTGDSRIGSTGTMNYLTSGEKQIIADWIDQGAPETAP